MRPVLENPNPLAFAQNNGVPETVKILALQSLGRSIPANVRGSETESLRSFVAKYDVGTRTKEEKMEELRVIFETHPAVSEFGGGDLIIVVLAFLGWRTWPHWRELRRYCGLDVSCADGNGKLHISRVRPHIRQIPLLACNHAKAR